MGQKSKSRGDETRDGRGDAEEGKRQCESCQIKSEQICKILKILSQTLVFLEEAKKWEAGRGDRPNDASGPTNRPVWKLRSDVTTLEENISNFLFSFSHHVSSAALGEYFFFDRGQGPIPYSP